MADSRIPLFRTDKDGAAKRSDELTPETELLEQSAVAIHVLVPEIVKQAAALAHDLEQTTAGMVILTVGLEVLLEASDPLREEGNLNLGRTSVAIAALVLGDDFGLLRCRDQVE